jgi:hypothetical protein
MALLADDVLDLREEPRVDAALLVDLLDAHAHAERVADVADAIGRGSPSCSAISSRSALIGRARRCRSRARAAPSGRLLEGAADRHHLAHRLHLRGEAGVGLRELLEREARILVTT